jgi:Xaa-Pro aminopeptidase
MKMYRGFFSRDEYEARWASVHEEMRKRGLEAALVWGRGGGSYERFQEVFYLTNYYSNQSGAVQDWHAVGTASAHCAVILRQGHEPLLIIDDIEGNWDASNLPLDNVVGDADVIKAVIDAVRKTGLSGKVGFVGSDFLGVKYYQQLTKACPEIRWEFHDDLVAVVRVIKSERELEAFRAGGETVTAAMNAVFDALQAGKSESEAAGDAAREVYRRRGHINLVLINHGVSTAEVLNTNPIAGYSDATPKQGDMARFWVYGAMCQGYWIDPGRTTVVGLNPSPEQKRLVEAAANSVTEMMEAVRPGVNVDEIVRLGERARADFGGEEDQMSTRWPLYGHGVGLYWDMPMMSPNYKGPHKVIRENMVCTTETFMALEGVGGAGFEQVFIVGKDGNELLSTTPMIWW